MTGASSSGMSPFHRLWALGYRRLVPIIPPLAELSPYSAIARKPNSRGKAVGELGPSGWRGLQWHTLETTEEHLDRWAAMQAGVGCRTGQGLVGIDIDVTHEGYAEQITRIAFETLGRAPRRIGRAPKVVLLYRTAADEYLPYQRVEIVMPDGSRQLVELSGEGRQIVLGGIHPGTLKPYQWPDGIPPFDDLVLVTGEQIKAFFERVVAEVPGATYKAPSVVNNAFVDQETLRGRLEDIRRCVALIPNDRSDRDRFTSLCIAIKAALPDEPEEAFQIAWSWAAQYVNPQTGEAKSYDRFVADWTGMRAPFRIGAKAVYDEAGRVTNMNQTPPDAFFGPVDPDTLDTSLFPKDVKTAAADSEIAWVDPASWKGVERPVKRWFIDGLVPEGEVTLLTGKGGIGKTLIVQQAITAIALGRPFLGRETIQAKVMALFCEDDEDVLHGRQKDICLSLLSDLSDLSDGMRLASRKYMDNLLSIWDRSSASMRLSNVYARLERDALAFGAKVVVIDTIADTFGGDEINRQQVRQFIQACAGRLAKAIGGAVILLGHPSRSGEQSGEGTSGSTAWHATVRSRLYLEEAGQPGSGYRKLASMKANYGPAGDSWVLRWQAGVLVPVSASRTVPLAGGTAGSVGGLPETASAVEQVVLEAVRAAAADGVRLSAARNSKFKAETLLRQRDPGAFTPYSAKEVEAALFSLIAKGHVGEGPVGRSGNRHTTTGLVVFASKNAPDFFD